MYLSASSSVRWGIGIVVVIIIIYIVASVRSVANGPVGQAVGNILGTAGGVLAAIAGLPPWLLIGLGITYLLSPAILKMGGAATRQLSTAVKEGNAKVESLRGTQSQDYLDAYARALATESVVRIRTVAAQDKDEKSDEYERLQAAKDARGRAIADAVSKGAEAEAGDAEGARDAKKYVYPDDE